MVEQARFVGILPDVRAADRDGHNLRAARVNGRPGLREILVLASAEQQARGIGLARDDQRIEVLVWLHRKWTRFGNEGWSIRQCTTRDARGKHGAPRRE